MIFRRSALALAALATAVGFASVTSATPGPQASPYAGTYQWNVAWAYVDSWTVTISDGGRITSSYTSPSDHQIKGTLTGRVHDDGSYSFTLKQTIPDIDDFPRPGHGPRYFTYSSTWTGSLAPDADGNLVGTPGTGASFVWLRQ